MEGRLVDVYLIAEAGFNRQDVEPELKVVTAAGTPGKGLPLQRWPDPGCQGSLPRSQGDRTTVSVDRLSWHTLLVGALLRSTAITKVELAIALRVSETGDRCRGGKVRVAKRFVRRDTLRRVEFEQLFKQVNGKRVRLGEHVLERHFRNPREGSQLDFGRIIDQALHGIVVWRAENAKDLVELVVVITASEERETGDHLCHDAACTPDVDGCRVGAGTEQHIGRTVPECDHLIGKRVDWNAKGTRQTKVGKFELTTLADEQVLWLEIAMKNTVLVAEGSRL